MLVTLRAAAEADAALWTRLQRGAFAALYAKYRDPANPHLRDEADFLRTRARADCRVILADGTPCGGVAAERRGDAMSLKRVFADPALRRRGVARAALQLLEEAYPADGRWTLTCPDENRAFYEKCGWRETGERAEAEGITLYIMEKRVPIIAAPAPCHRAAYEALIAEWEASGDKFVPYALAPRGRGYEEILADIRNDPDPARAFNGIPSRSLLYMDDGVILGAISLRERLDDALLESGGHIGYSVRPSARCKGHATRMLRLALYEYAARGVRRVLVTCDAANIASARVIEKNGGVLEDERIDKCGVPIRRYWIGTSDITGVSLP